MTREKAPLIFLLLTAFLILTVIVAKQVTRPIDLIATQLIQSVASTGLDYGMSLFTLLGSIEFSCFALLVVCWYLYRKHQRPEIFIYLFFFMAFSGVEYVWKYIVAYTGPGPEFNRNIFHLGLMVRTPYSFPSGHAFRSIFLLGIWYQHITQKHIQAKNGVLIQKVIILFLMIAIGVSRVYLGDHWASDVIGGFLLAGIGLLLASEPPQHELRPA